jgi:hypothetical protein
MGAVWKSVIESVGFLAQSKNADVVKIKIRMMMRFDEEDPSGA